MATKRIARPRDPIALAKLVGDIATAELWELADMVKVLEEWEAARGA